MSSAKPILIIDNGSFEIKAGLSTQKKPQFVFPSIVAVEKGVDTKKQVPQVGVGKEALKKQKSKEGIYSLRYPLQRGMVIEWDSLEQIYRYVLAQEGVQAAATGALLTLNVDSPVEHKEGLAQMFLELFNMDRVCLEIPSVLASKSSSQLLGGMTGNTVNGMFVDLGSGLTTVTPIVDGQCNYKQVRKMNLAGQDISLQLSRVMQQYSGYVLDSKEEYRIIQHVKHNMAYVCQDFNDELIGVKENPKQFLQQVELPNGEMLNLTRECFMGPEILFDPSIYGIQSNSALHKSVLDTAATAAKENIDSLLKNIFVFGGSSSLPGLTDRLQAEIKKIIGKKKINVTALPQHASWTGAQNGHPSLTNWISKQEFAEYGANIFLKKSKF